MPELPEVHTTVLGIKDQVEHQTVKAVEIHNPDCRLVPDQKLVDNLLGTQINQVYRKAKYIILENDKGYVVIHLGMSGYLRVQDTNQALIAHDHVRILFENGTSLIYNDTRRFGGVTFVEKGQLDQSKYFAHLGPDALSDDFNGEYLYEKSRKTTQVIKKFLMDNKIVLGIGNIYANETLFEVGINPYMIANELTLEQAQEIARVSKAILHMSCELGGTTIRDFKRPDGKLGYFVQKLKCYGKELEYLPEYDDIIISTQNINNRVSYFCLAKQPLTGKAIELHKEFVENAHQKALEKYHKLQEKQAQEQNEAQSKATKTSDKAKAASKTKTKTKASVKTKTSSKTK